MIKNVICLAVVVFLLSSCEEKFERLILVETCDVTAVGPRSAIVSGILLDAGEGAKQYGHCWDPVNEPTTEKSFYSQLGSKKDTGTFSSTLENLNPGSIYYFRAYARDGNNIVYGKTNFFYTQNLTTPIVSTDSVNEITPYSATVAGSLSNLGYGIDQVTQYGHCWAITHSPSTNDNKTELGITNTTGPFYSNLTNLLPETTYFVRAYAVNEKGLSYGQSVQFTTFGFEPVILTGGFANIDLTSADVYGSIEYLGYEIDLASEHGHCWSTSTGPTVSDFITTLGSTSSTGLFLSHLSGLNQNTLYYTRAYLITDYGTTYGNEVSFYTGDPYGVFLSDPNLEMYLPFNGNAEDLSANELNGIVNGATFTNDRYGKPNHALSLDGLDDNVNFGNVLNDVFTGDNKIFTFSFWMKAFDNDYNIIFGKTSDSNCDADERQFQIRYDEENKVGFFWYFSRSSATHYRYVKSETAYTDDTQWYHIIVSYNGTIDTNNGLDRIKIYTNGIPENCTLYSTGGTLSDIPWGSAPFAIGTDLSPEGTYCGQFNFHGLVDDVLIFSRELSTEEINYISVQRLK